LEPGEKRGCTTDGEHKVREKIERGSGARLDFFANIARGKKNSQKGRAFQ